MEAGKGEGTGRQGLSPHLIICPLTISSVQTLVSSFSSQTVPTSRCFDHPVPYRRDISSFENQNNSFLPFFFFFYLWVLLLPIPKSSQAWDTSKLGLNCYAIAIAV